MYKLGFKILCWLLGLLLLIGIGFYLYNRFFKQDEKPQATISNYEFLMTINERLRLVSEEVTLKRDINIRQGNYSAEGFAQLTAYIKYDLEKLEIDRPSADTCYIYLPEPDIEIGRTRESRSPSNTMNIIEVCLVLVVKILTIGMPYISLMKLYLKKQKTLYKTMLRLYKRLKPKPNNRLSNSSANYILTCISSYKKEFLTVRNLILRFLINNL